MNIFQNLLSPKFKKQLHTVAQTSTLVLCGLVMMGTRSVFALSDDQSQVLGSGIFYYNVNYCSADGVAGSTDLVGSDNLQRSFNFLTSTDRKPTPVTAVQAAGIIGNLMYESGSQKLDPSKEQGGAHGDTMTPGVGYGIAQWTDAGRQAGLTKYAAANNLKVSDLAAQLGYLWQELTTTESGALSALRPTTTVAAAATAFQDTYERPASLTASIAQRIAYGVSVMGLYGGTVTASDSGVTVAPANDGATSDSNCAAGSVTAIGNGTGKFTDGVPSAGNAGLYTGVATMLARAKEVNDPSSALFKSVCGRYSDGCYDRCDYLMAEMWGYANSGYETAAVHWDTMKSSGHGHLASAADGRKPPVGALLFYSTGHSAGHIAIYLGNNLILSNDVKGNGGAYIVSASAMETGPWHLTYLGWSDPIFAGSKN